MNTSLWIIGCGDIGLRVALRLRQQGVQATGVVSGAQSAARLAAAGIDARVQDLDGPGTTASGTVLWFAPPPSTGEEDTRVARFVASRPDVERLVYLSTSGVYGDTGGAWIDESAPIRPRTARGRRRAHAETLLGEWAVREGADLRILRVPGIYGPGRLPRSRLAEGLPLIVPEECPFTNRIHADDLAAASIAVLERGRSGRIYHVADGNPTTMTDYFLRCALLLGLPPPPLLPRDEARQHMSAAMWSFMDESKRLNVDRLRDEIGFRWQYPSLDTGLPATVAAEGTALS